MRWWTAAGWTLFAVSSLGLLLTGHGSVPVAGEGAIGVSVLGSAVTAAAALLLIRLVPPALDGGFPRLDRTRLLRQTWLLAGLAGLTPLAFGLLVALDLDRSLGLLIKLLMFFLAPLAGLALSGGIRLPRTRPAALWRWLGPVPAIVGYLWLFHGPFGRPEDGLAVSSLGTLVVTVFLVFLTASVGEEVFYRALLQTRLEALLGRWPAILLSALLFALMHLPTRLPILGDLGYTLAAVLAVQGVFGLVAGYLWSRYRNLWAVIALHAGVNHLSLLWLV
ncbi:CPBP family intramembrane glutamic endopeptidase [Crossiella cryophila]|uniref:Membrane protease YdiL (CAAX protease family) n=1 Tax=Crossiella cryophila TaxID=43355 RepID=A0A7W7C452_9PSEU|nr:type II CAAX endopeptidase family protein [Crossiella cryophila]MBB4674115.1 membrane protease YdiL (CAAX protease family) [Crossiella cryophila]